jgi:hypothetical protein
MASAFTSNDMILHQKNDKIISGGYSINSLLMQKQISPIAIQTGGKKQSNLNKLFDNLAIPAGLLFIRPNTTIHKYNTKVDKQPKLYDKLLNMVDKKKRLHFVNKTYRRKPLKNKTKKKRN